MKIDCPLRRMHRLVTPRKGQSIVLFPLMIFLVVAMTMMAVNYNYLSQKRIELQITADAAARTGAFVQAECLTGIANLNYIVAVLNPVIVILDALSAIPFLAFLKTISEFLSTLITAIINPAQNVIKTAAPFACFAAVLGQGQVTDSDTWTLMIPDRRSPPSNFLGVVPAEVATTGAIFGYTGTVMARNFKAINSDGTPDMNYDPLFSTIYEGLGVFAFKAKVPLPFTSLETMLGSTNPSNQAPFMYAVSAAKPYYTKYVPRGGTLDYYNKNRSMGLYIWAPINPWDARLISWDTYLKEAALGSPDSFATSKFSKLMTLVTTISTYKNSIQAIFSSLFGSGSSQ